MKKIFTTILFITTLVNIISAQQRVLNSSEIFIEIQKLAELKRVLYIAAHPDDENTRLISYFAREEKARTAYLSLTRGDGGQNLIGTEKGELMGLLRTNELLEARKIDGGEQFFTRANDFGYSKTSSETLTKWDKKLILGDVVWAIRRFQPDIIITRFPTSKYAGHGHHSTSAILAEEAFDLAADKSSYPEQLNYVSTWQPKKMYFNSSSWWDKELPAKVKNDVENYITIDVGAYNELLGKSYSEIAAESRTMHKSQGFGSSKSKGSKIEYLKHLKGSRSVGNNIFSGISTTWLGIDKADPIHAKLKKIIANYDFANPSKSVPDLLSVYKNTSKANGYWQKIKSRDIEKVILSCLGFYGELTAKDYYYTSADTITVNANFLNRSNIDIMLKSISINNVQTSLDSILSNNTPVKKTVKSVFSKFTNPQPYWLREPFTTMYTVSNPELIGNPLNKPCLEGEVKLLIEGVEMNFVLPINQKKTDPVRGELIRPVNIIPSITGKLSTSNIMCSVGSQQIVNLIVTANTNSVQGEININLPKGWKSSVSSVMYNIKEKNQIQEFNFIVTPGEKSEAGTLSILDEKGKSIKSKVVIEYDHITPQTLLPNCSAKLVLLDVKTVRQKIGYVVGAGDEIPNALKLLSYKVKILSESDLQVSDLTEFETIVTGIRAYNKNKYLAQINPKLMEYVQSGGNLVVQYCTSHRLVTDQIGPYPMDLGRDRVTVEEATPKILNPTHAIFNYPNAISDKDFDGWVQERGLYFAEEWDENYEALISWNDPDEDPVKGGLIVANYGKGTFIYTGISFFRELPAGVSGAFKLFTNLVEYKQ